METRMLAALLTGLLALGSLACGEDEGPAERAGRQLDEAIEGLRDSGEEMLEEIGDRVDEALEKTGDAIEDARKTTRKTTRR